MVFIIIINIIMVYRIFCSYVKLNSKIIAIVKEYFKTFSLCKSLSFFLYSFKSLFQEPFKVLQIKLQFIIQFLCA